MRFGGVTSPGNDPSRLSGRVSVPQQHNIEPFAAEHPGRCASRPLPLGSVEHLHLDLAGRVQHPDRPHRGLLRGRPREQSDSADEDQYGRTGQRELGPAVARLFQKRTVGSRTGHPVSIM